MMFSLSNLTDEYIEDYEALGLRLQDITAEFLIKANKINDIFIGFVFNDKEYEWFELESYKLKNLFVQSGNEQSKKIPEDIIEKYNGTHQPMIDVLVVEKDKHPYVKRIKNNYKSIHNVIDGYYEAIYPFDENVVILDDEDAKLKGKDWNRLVTYDDGNKLVLAGTFIVSGINETTLTSLTEDQIKKYKKMFYYPQVIHEKGHFIVVEDNIDMELE